MTCKLVVNSTYHDKVIISYCGRCFLIIQTGEKIMKNFRNEKSNLLNIKEVAEKLNISEGMARYYAKVNHWTKYGIKDDGKQVYYDSAEVAKAKTLIERIPSTKSQFDSITLLADEVMKPIDPINHFNGTINFSKMVEACKKDKYCITNHGRVINMTYLKMFESDTEDTNGYLQVRLNGMLFSRHQLTAYYFCDNAKNKTDVHHINGNKNDNRADNLVYCTTAEHGKAHKLMTEAKANNDWQAYNDYIEWLRADNKRAEQVKVIGRTTQDGQVFYLLISQSDYDAYKDDKGEPDIERLYLDNKVKVLMNEVQINEIRKEHKRLTQGINENE